MKKRNKSRIISFVSHRAFFVLSCLIFLFSSSAAFCGMKEELQKLAEIWRLPEYQTGSRVGMVSSYDRSGGNDDGFSGRYSFLRKEGEKLVIADLQGPGVVTRIWTPTPTSDLMEFYFDGESEPRIRIPFIDLFTGKVSPFLNPLVGHELGGYYCYLPIPYKQSLKICFLGKLMQFYQIEYRQLPPGETTESFAEKLGDFNWGRRPKLSDVQSGIEFLAYHWRLKPTDSYAWLPITGRELIAPPKAVGDPSLGIPTMDVSRDGKSIELERGKPVTIFELGHGGRVIALGVNPPPAFARNRGRDVMLRAWWDGEDTPAIQCPVADFFGYAFGQPSASSLLVGSDGEVNWCYLPMPFDKSAKIELFFDEDSYTNPYDMSPIRVDYSISFASDLPRSKTEGRFYAVRQNGSPKTGKPYEILNVEGRGHFVGCILQAQGLKPGMTTFFEGDDVATIDGEMRIHGTGSEDSFNGGWYALPDRWDEARSLPLSGCLGYSIPLARTGGYRFRLTDKLSFEKSFDLSIEHGPEKNDVPVEYTSVAIYYADHAPSSNSSSDFERAFAREKTFVPNALEFWPQLLPIRAFSQGSNISYGSWRDKETKMDYEILTLTPGGSSGFMKVEIEAPVADKYHLSVTYKKGPSYGKCRVDQRENPIGEAIDAYSPEPKMVERQEIGTIQLEPGKSTITFRIVGKNDSATGAEFSLHRIFLTRHFEPEG